MQVRLGDLYDLVVRIVDERLRQRMGTPSLPEEAAGDTLDGSSLLESSAPDDANWKSVQEQLVTLSELTRQLVEATQANQQRTEALLSDLLTAVRELTEAQKAFASSQSLQMEAASAELLKAFQQVLESHKTLAQQMASQRTEELLNEVLAAIQQLTETQKALANQPQQQRTEALLGEVLAAIQQLTETQKALANQPQQRTESVLNEVLAAIQQLTETQKALANQPQQQRTEVLLNELLSSVRQLTEFQRLQVNQPNQQRIETLLTELLLSVRELGESQKVLATQQRTEGMLMDLLRTLPQFSEGQRLSELAASQQRVATLLTEVLEELRQTTELQKALALRLNPQRTETLLAEVLNAIRQLPDRVNTESSRIPNGQQTESTSIVEKAVGKRGREAGEQDEVKPVSDRKARDGATNRSSTVERGASKESPPAELPEAVVSEPGNQQLKESLAEPVVEPLAADGTATAMISWDIDKLAEQLANYLESRLGIVVEFLQARQTPSSPLLQDAQVLVGEGTQNDQPMTLTVFCKPVVSPADVTVFYNAIVRPLRGSVAESVMGILLGETFEPKAQKVAHALDLLVIGTKELERNRRRS